MVKDNTTLGIVDYVIFIFLLLFSASIGIYYRCTGGKQKTTKEYLHADGNMSVLPVSASLVVSFMSALTLLGLSSEMYYIGTMYLITNIGNTIGAIVSSYCFVPVFYNLQATSAYEYLERRFGVITRTAASFAFFLQMILCSGVVLYAPSLALSAVTDISLAGSIISMGLVCTFYSVLGGMKAVLITDAFQAVLMVFAVVSVIVKGTINVGGLEEMWQRCQLGGRIDFFNFNPDPTIRYTFWSLVIGGFINYMNTSVSQMQVQRLMTVNSLKKSQRAIFLALPMQLFLMALVGLSGLTVFANYSDCDPYKQGRIDSLDQILPIFVMDSMSYIPGLAGLFIAGIFSAALSTISSTLNSLAAITMEDYVKPLMKHCGRNIIKDNKMSIHTQIIATVYGILCIGLAFIASGFKGILQLWLTIFAVVGGPLFGLFTLGMFVWTAEETGALVGLFSGLAISMWIGFGGPKPPLPYLPTRVDGCELVNFVNTTSVASASRDDEEYFYLYRVSYMWCGPIGFTVTLLVGALTSKLCKLMCSKYENKQLDANLFSPILSHILPQPIKKNLAVTNSDSMTKPDTMQIDVETHM